MDMATATRLTLGQTPMSKVSDGKAGFAFPQPTVTDRESESGLGTHGFGSVNKALGLY